jgi:hypothetical protein
MPRERNKAANNAVSALGFEATLWATADKLRDNPSLKNTLPKDYTRPHLDKQSLGGVIDLIGDIIAEVRGQKVILDSDLARLYGVPTFRFNEAVKRNQHRFPHDFRFQLTVEEWSAVRSSRRHEAGMNPAPGLTSHIAISSAEPSLNSSQIAMSSSAHGGRRTLPWALTAKLEAQFTESAKLEKAIRRNLELVNNSL